MRLILSYSIGILLLSGLCARVPYAYKNTQDLPVDAQMDRHMPVQSAPPTKVQTVQSDVSVVSKGSQTRPFRTTSSKKQMQEIPFGDVKKVSAGNDGVDFNQNVIILDDFNLGREEALNVPNEDDHQAAARGGTENDQEHQGAGQSIFVSYYKQPAPNNALARGRAPLTRRIEEDRDLQHS